MNSILDPFRPSNIKRWARIALFLTKWFGIFNSATMEIYLHRNFGPRYLVTLLGAVFFFLFCAALAPKPCGLTYLFFFGLAIRFPCHCLAAFRRPQVPGPLQSSYSAGTPWKLWQRLGLQPTTVQGYVEPAVCCLVSLPVTACDPFLGLWLIAGAASLFAKEQINRIQFTSRILDSLDAKYHAQALNAALKAYQQPPVAAGQSAHRAHLPPNPRRRHP